MSLNRFITMKKRWKSDAYTVYTNIATGGPCAVTESPGGLCGGVHGRRPGVAAGNGSLEFRRKNCMQEDMRTLTPM